MTVMQLLDLLGHLESWFVVLVVLWVALVIATVTLFVAAARYDDTDPAEDTDWDGLE